MNTTDILANQVYPDILLGEVYATDGKFSKLDSGYFAGKKPFEYMSGISILNNNERYINKDYPVPFISPIQTGHIPFNKNFADGTLLNIGDNVTFEEGKLANYSIKFNGSTESRVRYEPIDSNTTLDNFSVAFWFKSLSDNNDDQRRRIIEYTEDSKTFSIMIGDDADDHNLLVKLGDGVTSKVFNTGMNYNDNKWHYLIFEFYLGDFKLYVDTNKILDDHYDQYRETAFKVYLGNAGSNELNVGFIGNLDDFRLFKGNFHRENDRLYLYKYRENSFYSDVLNDNSCKMYFDFNNSLSASYYLYDAMWNKEQYKKYITGKRFGSAIELDGDNGISISHKHMQNELETADYPFYTRAWSVNLWFTTYNNSDDKTIFLLNDHSDSDSKSTIEVRQKYDSDNKVLYLYGVMYDSDGNKVEFSTENDVNSVIQENVTYMLTLVFDGDTITAYKNMIPIKPNVTKTDKSFEMPLTPTTLGGRAVRNEYYFTGSIEHYTFYDKTLNVEELMYLFKLNSKTTEPKLFRDYSEISAYKFDDAKDMFKRFDGDDDKVNYIKGRIAGSVLFNQDDAYIKYGNILTNTKDFSISIWIQTNKKDYRPIIYRESRNVMLSVNNGMLVINGSEVIPVNVTDGQLHNIILTNNKKVFIDGIPFNIDTTFNNVIENIWLGYDGNTSWVGEFELLRFFNKNIEEYEIPTILTEGL